MPSQSRKTFKHSIAAADLNRWLEDRLEAAKFKEYCPNGWQVAGRPRVSKIACAVTASLASIEAAIAADADALVVHHGIFWRGDNPCLVGPHGARVRRLITSGLNLWAYHLPLDVHPVWGNNQQLGEKMGWLTPGQRPTTSGEVGLVASTRLAQEQSCRQLSAALARRLGHKPLVVGDTQRPIRHLAWCTGAAQDNLALAIDLGCDAFVSGEISERTTHLAREAGVAYFSAGHYATEQYGVQAVTEAAASELAVPWVYIPDPNPV
jgi:dinuclear metal center YbgI/SA1388 family protein